MQHHTGIVLLAAALALSPPAHSAEVDGIRWERNVEYQGSPLTQALDVVWPRGQGPFPAVILLHDGDFSTGSRVDVASAAELFARNGYVSVAPDFRLAPRQQFPSPVHDVKSAVRWLRANAERYSVDPKRIAVVGYGTGGFVALFAGITRGVAGWEGIGPSTQHASDVACSVNVGGPADLSGAAGSGVAALLGGSAEAAPASHRQANPAVWVTPNSARTLWLTSATTGIQPLQERFQQAGVSLTVKAPGREAARDILEYLPGCFETVQRRIVLADHGRGSVNILEWPSGRVLWSVPNAQGHDAQVLANGNVLVTLDPQGRAVEFDHEKNIVWQFGPGEGFKRVVSAQRLANGNTLVAENDSGKVMEVTPLGQVAWTYQSADLGKNRMRAVRSTPAGTVLIANEAASRIIEVNRAGDIVWSHEVTQPGPRRPYQGLRLPNGNTVISLIDPGEVIEVTPGGKVVRSIGGSDGAIRLGWPSGFDVLANGHLLIGDYTAQRVIEVDTGGKIVHELRVPYRPATVAAAP